AKARFSKADSIFVVGDVHGRFDELAQLLQNARVVDQDLRWRGGKKHLIMLGDLFDRGHDVTRLLWFLYRLEHEARRQKGYVHLVLGNHEIMTMANDLRYLSGKENLIAANYGTTYDRLFDVKVSLLGKWLGSKPAIIKIDKVLFAHGGVAPNYAHYAIDAYNDSVFTFLREPVFHDLVADSAVVARYDSVYYENRLRFFFGSLSPFWFRGYVQTDTLGAFLDGVLDRYDANLHVVAHTPVPTITALYDGKLIAVDLHNAATEMLLLVKDGRKYKRFKYDLAGRVGEL
ncbi:MAG: metallophosphoesterase, partial [bacterium]